MVNRFFTGWFAVSLMGLAVQCFTDERNAPTTPVADRSTSHRLPDPDRGYQGVFACPPYFSLEPPGQTPKSFAPELFASHDNQLDGAAVISPDGRSSCWSLLPPAIMSVRCDDGTWTAPRPMPLPGKAVQAPAFSTDGSRLCFQATAAGELGSLVIWWWDATLLPTRGAR